MSGIKTSWVVTALMIVLVAGGLFYWHKRSSEPFGPTPERLTFKAAAPAGFTQVQAGDFNGTALKSGVDPAVALIRLERTGTGTIWIADAAGLDPGKAKDRAGGFGNATSVTSANGYSVSHYLDGEPGQLGGTDHYRLEGPRPHLLRRLQTGRAARAAAGRCNQLSAIPHVRARS